MSRLGGDIPAMERLHGQLVQKSQEIQRLRSELTNLVNGTYWEGPAAQRFRTDWSGQYSPNLTKLDQALNELGRAVQSRKDALIQVSA